MSDSPNIRLRTTGLRPRFLVNRPRAFQIPLSFALLLSMVFCAPAMKAQDAETDSAKPVPILSAGTAFVTNFEGGDPHLEPLIAPVLLVPFGDRWLFESRATFESDFSQLPGMSDFRGKVEKEVDYAQLDFIANRYLTISAGRYLTPFGIYNERLYPVWIRDLQSDPLILPIGIGPSNASTGAMLRGGFSANPQVTINYAVYFSALSTVTPVDSERTAGGRAGLFFPKLRLEVGGSFQHRLQDGRSNLFGAHVFWQPYSLPLDIRAEVARSREGSGYWIEPAYRLTQVPFLRDEMRRTQLVARVQQFWVGPLANDALPSVNSQVFEAGANYYFTDGLKGSFNYGRQFSSQGNVNVWTMAATYRFVLPFERGANQ